VSDAKSAPLVDAAGQRERDHVPELLLRHLAAREAHDGEVLAQRVRRGRTGVSALRKKQAQPTREKGAKGEKGEWARALGNVPS
jgi:hypothetical protein